MAIRLELPFLHVRIVSYPARLKIAPIVFSAMTAGGVLSRLAFLSPRGFLVFFGPLFPMRQSVRPLMIIVREGRHTAPDHDPM